MKHMFLIFIFAITAHVMKSQDITGQWNGILKVPGAQLRIVFHINQTDDGYVSTMDSPDQKATGIPITSTTYEGNKLTLKIANLMVEYVGTIGEGNIIEGTFNQSGQSFPMNLTREVPEKEEIKRPQEPQKPYPYYEEDVTFDNKEAGITLAGTLTLPEKEGLFPAVILISGSGPQNRNEELLNHKPFLVLADHLTRNGIAVLRYDDRGVAESTGDFATATSADFATDVESAVKYLQSRKEIANDKIGLVGHSEGGVIAPMVAANSSAVSYIVLLAGTGVPGDELLLEQQQLIFRASGIPAEDLKKIKSINQQAYQIVKEAKDTESLQKELTGYYQKTNADYPASLKAAGMSDEDRIKVSVAQISSPWFQYFFKYDPATSLKKVKCPVLAINGDKDLQVPAEMNLNAIKSALSKGGNKDVTIKTLPNLNHLFQECETGSPNEYAAIDQTFAPMALETVSTWILEQVK